MYLYIELWKPKEAWLKLTVAQRQAKMGELIEAAAKHPLSGVIPISFREAGDVLLFDGTTAQPSVIDDAEAQPTGFRFAAAWLILAREWIDKFEERVASLGWWYEYFDQQNAWGLMDGDATAKAMINHEDGSGGQQPGGDTKDSPKLGRIGRLERDIRNLVQSKKQPESAYEHLKEWGDIMVGRWASDDQSVKTGGVPVHSSAQWVAEKNALEGEFQFGPLTGNWLCIWDSQSRQIVQHTINSDGSTVRTIISKQTHTHWLWEQTFYYLDGQQETSTDNVTISENGNVLRHHITNRVRNGQKLPDVESVLRRVSVPSATAVAKLNESKEALSEKKRLRSGRRKASVRRRAGG